MPRSVTFALFFPFPPTQVQLRDIINTAQNLVRMLSNSVPVDVRPVKQGSTGEAAVGQGAQSVTTVRPQQAMQQRSQLNGPGLSVRQEMARYELFVLEYFLDFQITMYMTVLNT